MTTAAPDQLITLDQAAKFVPGADRDALKRLHRKGILTCYKPGKQLLTTAADVQEAVKTRCRVEPKDRDYGCAKPAPARTPPPGLSSTELARSALDSALE